MCPWALPPRVQVLSAGQEPEPPTWASRATETTCTPAALYIGSLASTVLREKQVKGYQPILDTKNPFH